MLTTPLNQRTVTLKLTRAEVCDLLVGCTAISESLENKGDTSAKWEALHDKIKAVLDAFDEKQNERS